MNKEELKADLKAVLDKHNVHIGFECGASSDLHGVYCERIAILSNDRSESVFETDGYYMYSSDIDNFP